ncbi:putative RNA-directed DNA polymerase [Aphis craccivora]|uniref:Putative RNA-directed DNA polymerase n=1 Tax=Aphis craccivora TaxID=307492 RepID=A0A6G0ZJK5_APHCR|nr:putative RNA-directed DNA polymerase [Aphis craccivora]
MKLFMCIESLEDCVTLQIDLNRFVVWSKSIGIELNICKCSIMTFSKRYSEIKFIYNINGTSLERSSGLVIDLGIKLTSNLDPRPHIDMTCCKALKSLGFIMQTV